MCEVLLFGETGAIERKVPDCLQRKSDVTLVSRPGVLLDKFHKVPELIVSVTGFCFALKLLRNFLSQTEKSKKKKF